MKKHYVQPSLALKQVESVELICTSQAITSDLGIDYGGVDEDGDITVECRRHHNIWDDDVSEEDW